MLGVYKAVIGLAVVIALVASSAALATPATTLDHARHLAERLGLASHRALPHATPEVVEGRARFATQQDRACDEHYSSVGTWCRSRAEEEGVNTDTITDPDGPATVTSDVWDHLRYSGTHCFSRRLAQSIADLVKREGGKSIGDFGCGPGYYAKFYYKAGLKAIGYEGSGGPAPPGIMLLNLADPQGHRADNYLPSFDFVVSLEVGEHIPAQFSENFLTTITSRARLGLILSWAVPGQGVNGNGHVHCQPNEWVIAQIENRGFIHLPMESEILRSVGGSDFDWFLNTILVFVR